MLRHRPLVARIARSLEPVDQDEMRARRNLGHLGDHQDTDTGLWISTIRRSEAGTSLRQSCEARSCRGWSEDADYEPEVRTAAISHSTASAIVPSTNCRFTPEYPVSPRARVLGMSVSVFTVRSGKQQPSNFVLLRRSLDEQLIHKFQTSVSSHGLAATALGGAALAQTTGGTGGRTSHRERNGRNHHACTPSKFPECR